MRIALFSPYLAEHTGGGERYMLAVAHCLERDHEVSIIVDRPTSELSRIRDRLEKSLNITLHRAQFISGPFGTPYTAVDRIRFTSRYDLFYYLTDGSFFYSRARYNLVHIQVPLGNPFKNPLNRLKFIPWKFRVANSEFTRKHIERLWGVNVQFVHRVPCQVQSFHPAKKDKSILSVGRFFTGLHNKKHEVLIQAFRKLIDAGIVGWKLVLAGSVDPASDNQRYVEDLRRKAQNVPIEFAVDVPFETLKSLYARAPIYWHAAGFDEDEDKHPERFEHFGITTVEAMAAGCVPLVFNGGGQREIIRSGENGFLWETKDELVALTKKVIQDAPGRDRLSHHARVSSMAFSEKAGCQKFKQILAEVTK